MNRILRPFGSVYDFKFGFVKILLLLETNREGPVTS